MSILLLLLLLLLQEMPGHRGQHRPDASLTLLLLICSTPINSYVIITTNHTYRYRYYYYYFNYYYMRTSIYMGIGLDFHQL